MIGSRYMGSHIKTPQDAGTRRILDAIRRIVRSLRLFDRQAERVVGLSGAQVFVLQKLAEAEEASVNELAARTRTHQSSVSVVVRKLERRGLIRRSRASTDARRLVLSLTPAGRRKLRSVPSSAQEKLVEALDRMKAENRRYLALLLEELIRETGIQEQPPSLFFEETGKSGSSKRTTPS
jgi:DNA-binding MarR family transcriptional regulator